MEKRRNLLWSFLRSIGEALFSLLFNFGGLLAGGLLAAYFNVFLELPWAIILYPGILSIRGAIGGLMSARISTALHLGTMKPTFFNNTKEANILFNTVTALTLMSTVVMWGFGTLFSIIFAGAELSDLFRIFLVIMSTMGISVIFISPLTFLTGIIAYKRGFDPDVLVYPVISTVSDVIITALYLIVLTIVIYYSSISLMLLSVINILFILYVFLSVRKIWKEKEFQRICKEYFLTLVICSLIVNITGSSLSKISEAIGRRPEIYMVYPALIDTVGDVGSITGSTATTKMAIGIIGTKFRDIKGHLAEIGSAFIASLIMFIAYAYVSAFFYGVKDIIQLMYILFSTHLIVVPIIVLISFVTAIETRKRGLDPDNFIIPIETSISDGLTTIALMLVLTLVV
ncbi:magnesium transporter [Candidatus Bathyarchaeota archaeon]|nr:magnesium transporter [Candidatus Bathyarchaeota archaeon]